MQNYKEELKDLIQKKESGQQLTQYELERFNEIKRYIQTKDYASYCKAMRPKYKWAWFHEYIMKKFDDATKRIGNSRLICRMHQQSGKSELFGRLAASYLFGKHPEWKILYVTYSDTRARELSADVLGLIASPEYQQIFPSVKLKDDVQSEVRTALKRKNKLTISNFTNMNSLRGEFKGVGIEGSMSGYDANLIILDDFFSGPDEAASQTIRDKRWKIFTQTILARQQKDTIILVMSTQWNDDDIIGRLDKYLEEKPADAPDWENIIFNAKKDDRDYPYDHRKIGEYLWSEQRMNVYLEMQAIDPVGWQTTYQNMPPKAGGQIFNATHFRYYDILPPIDSMKIVISVDPNYKKEAKKGDEAAIVVLGFTYDACYLIEWSSVNKVDIIDNMERINTYREKYPNHYQVLVEAKAQGEDIVSVFNRAGIFRVEPFDPTGKSKVWRASEMIPYCNGGKFILPSVAINPEIIGFTNEFLRFTGDDGGKDNLVDACSQVFIKYGYLLNPVTISHKKTVIHNKYNIGKGLTRLSNPMKRLRYGT